MNSNQDGNFCLDFKNFVIRIIDNMPLFIKIVVFSTIILYIINLFIPYVAYFLADIPYFTIFYVQIWRLITTSFITTNILSIIFSLFFWFREAVKVEKSTGTIKYMLIFLMNTFFINILYCVLMLLISLIIQNKSVLLLKVTQRGVKNDGLWPIMLCELTLLCLSNPEANMKLFLFPCVIKAKYYPLLLFLVFTIISGFSIDFENICGIGFGFLYHYYLKSRIKITNNFVMKIENSFLFKWMKNKRGFVGVGGMSVPVLQNNLENVRNVNISGNSRSNQKSFTPFGGKGTAVGSNSESSNNNKNKTEDKANTENKSNRDYNNISIGSSTDMNSSDSRLDLNSSNPKS
jgi:membrane associated rhomboid family serine protease